MILKIRTLLAQIRPSTWIALGLCALAVIDSSLPAFASSVASGAAGAPPPGSDPSAAVGGFQNQWIVPGVAAGSGLAAAGGTIGTMVRHDKKEGFVAMAAVGFVGIVGCSAMYAIPAAVKFTAQQASGALLAHPHAIHAAHVVVTIAQHLH